MKGRKRTPTPVLAARGSWRAKTRPDEPIIEAKEPDCPAHLDEGAQIEWARVVPLLMAMRVLSPADRGVVAVYCMAYSRWQRAETEIAAGGHVVTLSGGRQLQSPWLGIATKAMEQVHKLSAELGITPASRSRVSAAPDGDKKPAAKPATPMMRIAQ